MDTGGGTSSAGSSKAYIPQAQPMADTGYQNLTSQFFNLSNNALNQFPGAYPPAVAYPTAQDVLNQVNTNPYAQPAVDAASSAGQIFSGGYLPNAFQGSQSLANFGNLASSLTPNITSAIGNPNYGAANAAGYNLSGPLQGGVTAALGDINNPAYGNALNYGSGVSNDLYGASKGILADINNPNYQNAVTYGTGVSNDLYGAGKNILGTAFDPQSALYNRTLSQINDQTNAQLANAGLAGTPYGASVLGNTDANFNIDWQNNQLARQAQGAQAAGTAYGTGLQSMLSPTQARTQAGATDLGAGGAGLTQGLSALINPATARTQAGATDLGAASTGASSALSSLLQPANAQVTANSLGTGALSNLSGIANSGFTGAGNLLSNAAAGTAQYGALPYSQFNTIQGNRDSAAQNVEAIGNQLYTLPQQTLNDLQSYLGLGQSASNLANSIGSTNFNQLASGIGGAAQLGSSLFGGGGSGGGGFLGNIGSGIGSLIGGGTEATGAAGDALALSGLATDVSGGTGIDTIASIAPLAFSG